MTFQVGDLYEGWARATLLQLVMQRVGMLP